MASLFAASLDAVQSAKSADASGQLTLQTEPFLQCCRQILPVVDAFGQSMYLVKADIGGNIERLAEALKREPEKYKELYTIVQEEVKAGTAQGAKSCTQALLWLTRAMDFLFGLLKNLEADPSCTVQVAATKAYDAHLRPYHGWIASSAFSTVLYFCPSRESFFKTLGPGYVQKDLNLLLEKVEPLLLENHQYLDSVGCDKLSAA